MAEQESVLCRLHRGQAVVIEDYLCRGTTRHAQREEATDRYEVIFPRRGVFARRNRWGTAIATPGQILFFNRNEPYEVSHPVTGGDDSTVIGLDRSTAVQMVMAARPPSAPHAGDAEVPFCWAMTPSTAPLSLRHARLLGWLCARTGAAADAECLLVEETALELAADAVAAAIAGAVPRQQALAPQSAPTERQRELARQVQVTLGAAFHQPLTLSWVAREVASSPFHLARAYKAVTGRTIHQQLIATRLCASLDMLLEPVPRPLTEIAFGTGFSSHSHFTSAFRRAFHQTPSAFKQTVTARDEAQLRKNLTAS